MSETTFTPGPWRIEVEDIGDEDCVIVPVYVRGPNGEQVVDSEGGLYTWDKRSMDTVKADANLIAAAPDLYAALQAIVAAELESIDELVKEYGFDPEDRPSWLVRLRAAEAALAKARGEETR